MPTDAPILNPYTTDGLCYIIRQPDEYLKIGFSLALEKRLKSLVKDIGGQPELLCVQYGGYYQERWLHHRFRDWRLPGAGEMFFPAPEILHYCEVVGISAWSLDKVSGWTAKKR